jgi:hypothetical protein
MGWGKGKGGRGRGRGRGRIVLMLFFCCILLVNRCWLPYPFLFVVFVSFLPSLFGRFWGVRWVISVDVETGVRFFVVVGYFYIPTIPSYSYS